MKTASQHHQTFKVARHGLFFAVALLILGVPVGLIMKQPDLGTSLLVLAAGLAVIFFAGLPWRWILPVIVVLAVGAGHFVFSVHLLARLIRQGNHFLIGQIERLDSLAARTHHATHIHCLAACRQASDGQHSGQCTHTKSHELPLLLIKREAILMTRQRRIPI